MHVYVIHDGVMAKVTKWLAYGVEAEYDLMGIHHEVILDKEDYIEVEDE